MADEVRELLDKGEEAKKLMIQYNIGLIYYTARCVVFGKVRTEMRFLLVCIKVRSQGSIAET